MTIPNIWEKKHPNHQQVTIFIKAFVAKITLVPPAIWAINLHPGRMGCAMEVGFKGIGCGRGRMGAGGGGGWCGPGAGLRHWGKWWETYVNVIKCPKKLGSLEDFGHHLQIYLLEILSPRVGWCLIWTCTNPWKWQAICKMYRCCEFCYPNCCSSHQEIVFVNHQKLGAWTALICLNNIWEINHQTANRRGCNQPEGDLNLQQKLPGPALGKLLKVRNETTQDCLKVLVCYLLPSIT